MKKSTRAILSLSGLTAVALSIFLLGIPGPARTSDPASPAGALAPSGGAPTPAFAAPSSLPADAVASETLASDPVALAVAREKHRLATGRAGAEILSEVSLRESVTSEPPHAIRRLEAVGRDGRVLAFREMVAGEVLLSFDDSMGTTSVRGWLDARRLSPIRKAVTTNLWRVRVPAGSSIETVLALHGGDAGVSIAEPNYIVRATATPNDPSYGSLWGMKKIQADLAWDVQKGSAAVVVADIDTGVDYAHPDLAANMWRNPGEIAGNGMDDDGNGFADDVYGYDFVNTDADPMDDNGHGTHTAGTVGAVGNNGVGVVGVNWTVRIMALKFLSASGSGSTFDAVECTNYATRMGAKVMNNSWGGGGASSTLQAAIEDANAAGALFAAAAGNSKKNNDRFPYYPASYNVPNVIAVAASDSSDNLASFSSYGKTSVHLAAPGVGILSTTGGAYASWSGTSMATPPVSGALALLFAQTPGMGHLDAKARMLASVDRVPALANYVVNGGRLNVYNMVRETTGNQPPIAIASASPTSGTAPLAVSFSGAGSSDPDGTIAAWAWSFGDGATGTGVTVNHTYAANGTYTAVLTVTDDDGASASKSVVIAVGPSGKPPRPKSR